MPIVLVTPPAVEPITLSDLKHQLGLSPVEDSDHIKSDQLRILLRRYITSARVECENRTRRAFITQTWKLQLDRWHHRDPRHMDCHLHTIKLPKPPFQSMVSVQYVDLSGAVQTLTQQTDYGASLPTTPFGYQLDPGSETQPARLTPAYQNFWPPVRWVQNAISITFKAGYGDSGAAVPASITQAILFLAHSYYDSTAFKDIDGLVNGLLMPYMHRTS